MGDDVRKGLWILKERETHRRIRRKKTSPREVHMASAAATSIELCELHFVQGLLTRIHGEYQRTNSATMKHQNNEYVVEISLSLL